MFPMMLMSGRFFPIQKMPGFLQKFARTLPLCRVNKGLRASTVFVNNMAQLKDSVEIKVLSAVVVVLGKMTTTLSHEPT